MLFYRSITETNWREGDSHNGSDVDVGLNTDLVLSQPAEADY